MRCVVSVKRNVTFILIQVIRALFECVKKCSAVLVRQYMKITIAFSKSLRILAGHILQKGIYLKSFNRNG